MPFRSSEPEAGARNSKKLWEGWLLSAGGPHSDGSGRPSGAFPGWKDHYRASQAAWIEPPWKSLRFAGNQRGRGSLVSLCGMSPFRELEEVPLRPRAPDLPTRLCGCSNSKGSHAQRGPGWQHAICLLKVKNKKVNSEKNRNRLSRVLTQDTSGVMDEGILFLCNNYCLANRLEGTGARTQS